MIVIVTTCHVLVKVWWRRFVRFSLTAAGRACLPTFVSFVAWWTCCAWDTCVESIARLGLCVAVFWQSRGVLRSLLRFWDHSCWTLERGRSLAWRAPQNRLEHEVSLWSFAASYFWCCIVEDSVNLTCTCNMKPKKVAIKNMNKKLTGKVRRRQIVSFLTCCCCWLFLVARNQVNLVSR